MVGTFQKTKTLDDFRNAILDHWAKGYMRVELEELTFIHGQSEYNLKNKNIIEIISIEGERNDGYYIPPEGTFNNVNSLVKGIDYDLVYDTLIKDDYNKILYDRLKFYDTKLFKNNTKIYVSYIYYDSDRKSKITNFSKGSVAYMIANSIATSIYNLYSLQNRNYASNFIDTAFGTDLDNYANLYGLERGTGTKAKGYVHVYVASGTGDITVTTTNAFVANIMGERLIFNPTTGGTASEGTTTEFEVEASDIGAKYNVGSYSINSMYISNSLVNIVSGVTISNPPLKLDGTENVFSGGTDVESDRELRNRIKASIGSSNRGSKTSIINALFSGISTVNDVKIYDWEDNKGISNSVFYVNISGKSGNKLLNDQGTVTNIKKIIDEYRPVAISYSIIDPNIVKLYVSGTVYFTNDNFNIASGVIENAKSNLEKYINELKIGEDLLISEMVRIVKSDNDVYDFKVDDIKYTEFVTEPNVKDDFVMIIDNTTGTQVESVLYHEIKFLSKGKVDTVLYSGTNTITTTYSGIVDVPKPSVYISYDDGTGQYIRNPAYSIDFYKSNDKTSVTIDPNIGSGVRILVPNVDYINIYYEIAETDTIDGLRVELDCLLASGDNPTVYVEIWESTTNSPTSGTRLSSDTITPISGTNIYEIIFSTPLTVSDPERIYYVVFSGTGTLSSGSYVSAVSNTDQIGGNIFTRFYSGTATSMNDGSWTLLDNKTTTIHTIISGSSTSNVEIEDKAMIPDLGSLYKVELGFQII